MAIYYHMKTITRILLIVPITFCFTAGASAATFSVNTTADSADANPGDGVCADSGGSCSLRAAISQANALPGADIITLGAATYTQTLAAANEDLNAGGDWDITSDITINGVSQASTILQAAATPNTASERVLDVRSGGGRLTLINATVRHGRYSASVPLRGGGIQNLGTLILTGVAVTANNVTGLGGSAIGGGIYNSGLALTLTDTTVTGNALQNFVSGSSIGGGVASLSASFIIITNSSISGNTADSVNGLATGGGIYMENIFILTATDSHFDGNIITGPSNSSGGGGLRAVSTVATARMTVTGCTFNGNYGTGAGSASGIGIQLSTATLSNSTLDATLDRATIGGNVAGGSGGGSRGVGLNAAISGGHLTLSVLNSSISNNTGGSNGGGVWVSNASGMTSSGGTFNFTNSTISGNAANDSGGGVYFERTNLAQISMNMNFVTVANNRAGNDNTGSDSGGGIIRAITGTLSLQNSIVADNSVGTNATAPDISGTFVSQDYNHIEDASGAIFTPLSNDTTGTDPQLGPLQYNGGPTPTQLPLYGSPVINTISSGSSGCGTDITTDQRGFPRPSGASCDKGSAERTAYPAGPWSLSGTVKTTTGMPIRNAAVTISGGALPAPVTVFTGNLGTYQFTNLTGEEYTVSVSVKRYHFNEASQVFAVGADITNADFIANAPFGREAFDLEVGPVKSKSLR